MLSPPLLNDALTRFSSGVGGGGDIGSTGNPDTGAGVRKIQKRGAAMTRAEIEAALAWLLRLTRYYEHNPAGQGVGEHRGEV